MSTSIDPAILLSDDPSFVVGSPEGVGLLCRIQRADPCCGGEREVGIVAQPARLDGSGGATPTDDPLLDLRVGIDCGYLYYGEGGIVGVADAPGLKELEAALDGRVLDALAQRWLSERGRENRSGQRRGDADLLGWMPEHPLLWEEAFEVLREENLHGPRGCYSVFDLYFVEGYSDRRDVILHFDEGPHEPTKIVGSVRIDLAEEEDMEMLPSQGCAELLEYLWDRYRQRYPDLSHLDTRWDRMRELGLEIRKKQKKSRRRSRRA